MATFNLSYYRKLKQLVAKKKSLITTDKDLQKKDLIDSGFKLISATGEEDKLTKLSTSSFTKYDIICFYEKIESKEIKAN